MEKHYCLFLELAASALGDTVPDRKIIDGISPDILNKAAALAKAQDMAHIMSSALSKCSLPENEEITALTAKLSKAEMIAAFRHEQLVYELGEIRKALDGAEVVYMPLKGSVVRDYYPRPYFRTSCDIDVLVHKEQLDSAIKALTEGLGYSVKGEESYHDISLFSPSGIHLELHFNICENQEKLDRLLSRVWEFSHPVSEGSFEYRQTNEFLMFHLVAHAAYHFLDGGCGVKPIADIAILSKKIEYDADTLAEYCRECGLETFYSKLLRLADIWFGEGEYDEVTEQMAEYILGAGVYGSKENKIAVKQDKTGSKLGYLWRRIFIPYDELKYFYPKLQKKKWLLPYYEVKRWFRLIFGGKLNSSVSELKTGLNMSEEKSARVVGLMKKLEL